MIESYFKLIYATTLCFLFIHTSRASLVIAIYNDNRLFLGSDTQATSFNTNSVASGGHQMAAKMFPISSTCFAAMTGYDGPIMNTAPNNGRNGNLDLLNILKNDTTNQFPLKVALTNKIQNVVRDFYSSFNALSQIPTTTAFNSHGRDTLLVFWGYNKDSDSFFNDCFLLAPGGVVKRFSIFKRGKEKIGDNIAFQGETDFLHGVLQNREQKYASLRDSEFNSDVKSISMNKHLSDKAMVRFMLMMFHLHKDHAKDFFPDEGFVGEPYIIDKITKKDSVQLYVGK